MSIAESLSKTLDIVLFDREAGWFTPLAQALDTLTAEHAASVPGPGFNNIWVVVHHVTVSHEYYLLRFQGLPIDSLQAALDNDWAPIPSPGDERAWQVARDRALSSGRELARLASAYSDADLLQPYAPGKSTRFQALQSIVAHDSYHACEIVNIRHMLGLWLDGA